MAARVMVHVQPGARQEGVAWLVPVGALKVKVTARAVEGQANQAVETLLARLLGLPRARVRVARGATSRRKLIEVAGLDPAELKQRLAAALGAGPPQQKD